MGSVEVEDSAWWRLKKRIADIQAVIKKPPVELFSRTVQGVKDTIAVAIPAGNDNFTWIDGLDITADLTGGDVLIDWMVILSMSPLTPTWLFAVEVDGLVIRSKYNRFSPTLTQRIQWAGQFTENVGPGSHRYRLMVSSNGATSVVLYRTYRYFRVTGLRDTRKA